MKKNNSKIYISNYWWNYNNYGAILTGYAIHNLVDNSIMIDDLNIWIHKLVNKKYNFSIDFKQKYLKIFNPKSNYKNLVLLNNYSKTFITGSDQVFRLCSNQNERLHHYLLNFAALDSKKIAFSASFGFDKAELLQLTSRENINIAKNALKSFDFISVREKSGVEICRDIFDVDAEWIIDPVFILEKTKYDELIDNATKDYSNKIVSYVLDNNKSYDKAYRRLEKQHGSRVIKLADSNESVENWLSAIKNCKLFVTDSFHGLCFALIFNKPFICISNKARGATRFDSILEMLNIENQCINSIDEIYTKNCIFKVDYEKVNQRIKEERQKGLAFLQKALESPVGKFEEKQAVRTQYLEETVCKLEQQANLKYQIKKELWNLWLIIFHKYLPEPVKNIIRKIRGSK